MSIEDADKLVAEYNESNFQITRLHFIWLACKSARENGRLLKYRWLLDSASIELWADTMRLDEVNDKPEMKYEFRLQQVDKEVAEAVEEKSQENLYKSLIKKEKILRELQQECGKGARLRSGEDDYM